MNPKIQKLRAELEKNNEKISKLQSRNTEIKQQIRELEDMDLIGIPYRVTVGRGVKDGNVELKTRATGDVQEVSLEEITAVLQKLLAA